MGKFKDLTGRQFGRLTAIEPFITTAREEHGFDVGVQVRVWRNGDCTGNGPCQRTHEVVRMLSQDAKGDAERRTATASNMGEYETAMR